MCIVKLPFGADLEIGKARVGDFLIQKKLDLTEAQLLLLDPALLSSRAEVESRAGWSPLVHTGQWHHL